MANVVQSRYTSEQITAWLRGLLTIALADGDFDPEEQELIAAIAQEQLSPQPNVCSLEPISPKELAQLFAQDTHAAENFLRTAVMVALADGIFSFSEDKILREFCTALGHEPTELDALRHTLVDHETGTDKPHHHPDVLHPIRNWLDGLEVHDPRLAKFLCKMVPSQCPFERDIILFGRKVVHIPPMCKLNPLYEQLVGLRFRALSYLADDCHEDISPYM